jgi:hypothetical protein
MALGDRATGNEVQKTNAGIKQRLLYLGVDVLSKQAWWG